MEMRRRQVRRQKMILGGAAGGVLLLLILVLAIRAMAAGAERQQEAEKEKQQAQEAQKKEPEKVSLTISAAGDCTLGTDENFYYATSLPAKYEAVQDPGYFFQKVLPVFSQDDLTIVNMEGILTAEELQREIKQFAFKGDPEYVQILTEGSVEAANLANNHSRDYGEQSYTDTIEIMENAGIPTFGYDRTALLDVKGVKVGLVGTYELADHMGCEEEMIQNIESLKEQGAQLIIASFHWGIERTNVPNEIQVDLAHSAIDHGADLVLGHHPHVLQGIETYKGKNIVYSLGNFCFGGNSGPNDMDAMIFQQTFTLEDGELVEDNVTSITPVKISGSWAQGVNDYQPTPVEGDIGEGIISRIEEYSQSLADQYGTEPAVINSSLDSDQEESQSGTVEGNAVEENSEAGVVNETEESSS
ncbi:MAG TPA: CapA family protein [Candidatus Blautia ornithocaccae]|nr:CapA family protein [Candidatus Blautia ornithocaccae]